MLNSIDTRFEVVVCDDLSTDGVQELLAEIHDDRFKYFRNDTNLGAHQNWLKSLEFGQGKWLYLIMGRDRVNGEYITRLIDLLEQVCIDGVVYVKDTESYQVGERDYTGKAWSKLFSGIDAMAKFINYNHQTSEIFLREALMSVSERKKYFSIADMYPENYAIRDMLLNGKGALIHSGVRNTGCFTDTSRVISKVEYAVDLEKTYFAPARRIKQFFEQIDMIDSLPSGTFTRKELDKFFRRKYYGMLMIISEKFRAWCREPDTMAHYGHSVKYVTIPEMIRNIIKAYHSTKDHLKTEGRYTFTRQSIMSWCTVKAAICAPIMSEARIIFRALGIYSVIRYVRNLLV